MNFEFGWKLCKKSPPIQLNKYLIMYTRSWYRKRIFLFPLIFVGARVELYWGLVVKKTLASGGEGLREPCEGGGVTETL